MTWFSRRHDEERKPEVRPDIAALNKLARSLSKAWMPGMMRDYKLQEAERVRRGIPPTVYVSKEQSATRAEDLSRSLETATADWEDERGFRTEIIGMYVSNQRGHLPPGTDGLITEYKVSRWYVNLADKDDDYVTATVYITKDSMQTSLKIDRLPTDAQRKVAERRGVSLHSRAQIGYSIAELEPNGRSWKQYYGGGYDTAESHDFVAKAIEDLPRFVLDD